MGNMAMAPIDVVFGDKTYSMSPLTDADKGELDNWVRSEFLATAKLGAGAPDDEHYAPIMRIALLEAAQLSWTRSPGSAMAATRKGIARIAWQGIRRKHPNVPLSEIDEALRTIAAVEEFHEKYRIVNDIKPRRETKETTPSADPSHSRSNTLSSQPMESSQSPTS